MSFTGRENIFWRILIVLLFKRVEMYLSVCFMPNYKWANSMFSQIISLCWKSIVPNATWNNRKLHRLKNTKSVLVLVFDKKRKWNNPFFKEIIPSAGTLKLVCFCSWRKFLIMIIITIYRVTTMYHTLWMTFLPLL